MQRRGLIAAGVLLCAVSVSCPASGSQVWGMDPRVVSERLYAGRTEFLRHVSFSRHRIEEITRLGPDAAYATGLIYLDLGMGEIAERLFRLAWRTSPEPFRRQAVLELLAWHGGRDDHEAAEAIAREALRSYPRDGDVLAGLVRSLYHLERYEEAAPLAAELHLLLAEDRPATSSLRQEAALWHAVCAIHVGLPDWPELTRRLFSDYPAGAVHSRVWVFLLARAEVRLRFSPDEQRFFRAKQLLAEGRATEAADAFGEVGSSSPLWGPYGLLDWFRSLSLSGRLTAGAAALSAYAEQSEPDLARRAWEYSGRLMRSAGLHGEAVALLERSLSFSASGADEMRVRWFWLSSKVRGSPAQAAREAAVIAPLLSDPAYFADVLVELAGTLAGAGRWQELLLAYEGLSGYATAGTLARYELIVARALERGLLVSGSLVPSEYLGRAAAQREDRFAALLATALLGASGADVLSLPPGDAVLAEVTPPPAAGPQETEAAALAVAYLRFGLLDRLQRQASAADSRLDPDLLVVAADRLAAAGRIRESIGLLGRFEAAGGLLTSPVARLRYPEAFAPIVERVSAVEQIDRWLFYGLLREESLFDPLIVSRAGAVGLAQLMPATAADVGARMRLGEPDLTDPSDNLRIGGRYLAMLTAQFGSPARALAAYNAGQGNVRRWETRWPGLDEVLFHQVTPFAETYEHVRKVVVSAAWYGYLYAAREPTELVRYVFSLE